MAKFLIRIILIFLSNLAALYTAAYFIPGLQIESGWKNFAIVALIFTFINLLIKPILKIILIPLILITFGIASFFINMFLLYFLTLISNKITISGISALFYATIIISVVNYLMHFITKPITK